MPPFYKSRKGKVKHMYKIQNKDDLRDFLVEETILTDTIADMEGMRCEELYGENPSWEDLYDSQLSEEELLDLLFTEVKNNYISMPVFDGDYLRELDDMYSYGYLSIQEKILNDYFIDNCEDPERQAEEVSKHYDLNEEVDYEY